MECTEQMYIKHCLSIFDTHIVECSVAHDSSIIHNDVEGSKLVKCLVNHGSSAPFIRDVVVARDSNTPSRLDLINDKVRAERWARLPACTTKVVDHDPCSPAGQFK